MSYLAALKMLETPSSLPTKPTEPGLVGFVGSSLGGMQEFKAEYQDSGPQTLRACSWRIIYADKPPKLVIVVPAMTEAEVLAGEVGALMAEVAQGCNQCRHYLKPGLSAGYCFSEDRSDLEPAYGFAHGAKHLPSDHDAACVQFGSQE